MLVKPVEQRGVHKVTSDEWVEHAIKLIGTPELTTFFTGCPIEIPAAQALKNKAIQLRSSNVKSALDIVDLILSASKITNEPIHRGYGLWGNAVVRSLALGEFVIALESYDEAIAIFDAVGDRVSPALMQISRLWSLVSLGQPEKALEAGREAGEVLRAHKRWLELATLEMNLGSVYSKLGEDAHALTRYENAQHSYEMVGLDTSEIRSLWAHATHNRAVSLSSLGDLNDSITEAQRALAVHLQLENSVEIARVKQHLGFTYYIQGRFNNAFQMLEEARELFVILDMKRNAARVDLYLCEYLLRLRRFHDALRKGTAAQVVFHELQATHEEGLAALYIAISFAGVNQQTEALVKLEAAKDLFSQEKSEVWLAHVELEKANLFAKQKDYLDSLASAQFCIDSFNTHQLQINFADALVVAADALRALNRYNEAKKAIEQVDEISKINSLPWLVMQSHRVLAAIAKDEGRITHAIQEYLEAIAALERLRGSLMIEFRVSFQEDKQTLYEEIVELYLSTGQINQALTYVERAKSRTLVEMFDQRLDMEVCARQDSDVPLIEALHRLRRERDSLYRRREKNEDVHERGWYSTIESEDTRQRILHIEAEITELWHTLLSRNASYTQDANFWNISNESFSVDLPPDTLLVEYFAIHDKLIVFLVSSQDIVVQRLDCEMPQIQQWLERWHRHLRSVPAFSTSQISAVEQQARFLLNLPYQLLIQPISEKLNLFERLIFVPHGVLHYVPFHALHNGSLYLIEDHAISYLPNSTILDQCRKQRITSGGMLSLGYSSDGMLPFTIQEAEQVTRCIEGKLLLEDDATLSNFRDSLADQRILHLATHAEYNADQPLFSGLMLADGWLTTLDIFNLKLNASLVTLSACQTGRSVIGGGDELLGLMRAFFYAGTASLVLSLWSVEDRSTLILMESLYRSLAQGQRKDDALRHAQMYLLQQAQDGLDADKKKLVHPYYWAPFCLSGDTQGFT